MFLYFYFSYHNLTFQELFDHEKFNLEGQIAHAEYGDTFTVDTGKFTGRSPNDKWIVLNKGSETAENIDWGAVNQVSKTQIIGIFRRLPIHSLLSIFYGNSFTMFIAYFSRSV